MTHLHVVADHGPETPIHSVRVPPRDLAVQDISDFEYLASLVVGNGHVALQELRDGLERRDIDATIAGCRRLLAVAYLAKSRADQLEARNR